MSSASLDLVYRALADPTRRRLLERLVREPGLTSGELARESRNVSRWAVLKHLSALREAGLVETLEEGRHRRHYANTTALDLADRWVADIRGSARAAGGERQPDA